MTALILPEKDFYQCLNDDTLNDRNIIVDFEVVVDNSSITWHFRQLKNIVFKEKVIIRDAEINSGLAFIDCAFEKGLVFHKIKSTNFNSTYNDSNSSILFSGCKSDFIAFANECIFERSVVVKENCTISKISINKTVVINAGLSIKNSTISYLDISNSNFDINLSNSIFDKPLRIESLIGNIGFVSNEFKDWVKFWNVECNFSFASNKNKFEEEFKIEASRIKVLTFYNDEFRKKGELENRDLSGNNLETSIKEVYISETNFIEGFDFNGLGKKLDKLNLTITPEFKGVLNFDNWIIDTTNIYGVNQNLKLLFKNISYRFLLINDFTNFSDISFDRCKGVDDCTLNLFNSDLGSTRFNEFDFESFKELRFNNISIEKIRPSNIKWFDDNKLKIEIPEQTEEEKHKRKREIYRQFKQALKNNGNQIDSLIFQAREFESHRNELKSSENYSLGERLIMLVSQTNDYGLNWIKPLVLTLYFTLLYYIFIIPIIDKELDYSFFPSLSDIDLKLKLIAKRIDVFWQLFNPVRDTTKVYGFGENKELKSNWIYFFDLLHRIFLGIMIFQIIKAFRKYVSN